MELNEEWQREFLGVFPDAKFLKEGGYNYIYIAELKLPQNCSPNVVPTMLCISQKDGYYSRLYLPQQINGSIPRNWNSAIYLLDKTWHSISWQTQADMSYLEMLMVHLNAFK